MSIDDLANLADALTFALLVTVGGLIAWATIRATSRRPNLRRAMKVGLSSGRSWRSASPGWPCGPRLVRAWTPSRTAWSGVNRRRRSTPPRESRSWLPNPPRLPHRAARRAASRGRAGATESSTRRPRATTVPEARAAVPAPIRARGRTPVRTPVPPRRRLPRRLRRLHLLLIPRRRRPHHPPRRHLPPVSLGLRPDRPARLRVVGGDRPSENHALPHGLTLGHRARPSHRTGRLTFAFDVEVVRWACSGAICRSGATPACHREKQAEAR